MVATDGSEVGLPKRRLLGFYITLPIVAAVVVSIAISAGNGQKAQKSIAGGYDIETPNACLGKKADVKQSGRFVSLSNTLGTLGGSLDFKNGHLTGTVDCISGPSRKIDAHAAGGRIDGRLGGVPIALGQKRDPPAPGTPQPYIPGSIGGDYKLSPRSDCLGGTITLGGGHSPSVEAQGTKLGRLGYSKGTISGQVKCKRAGAATGQGTAPERPPSLPPSTP